MEDNEIIKALECCAQPIPICKECPCYDSNVPYPCADQLKWATLNLIDSQQAEIERFKIENQSLRSAATSYKIHYNKARVEAIREFAERLKEFYSGEFITDDCHCAVGVIKQNIDDLLREMEGDIE